jgi:hypothetical protein
LATTPGRVAKGGLNGERQAAGFDGHGDGTANRDPGRAAIGVMPTLPALKVV